MIGLGLTRGYFNQVDHVGGTFRVNGWLATPGKLVDSFRITVGDSISVTAPAYEMPEVTRTIQHLPNTNGRVFQAEIACTLEPSTWIDVSVYGQQHGVDVGCLSLDFVPGYADGLPLPPTHLRVRVTSNESPELFRAMALKTLSDFRRALGRHQVFEIRRLLDWGCGCGRVTALLAKHMASVNVHGCDVDAEAIAWCSENLDGASFRQIPFEPPTTFDDAMFDVILGCSVFTHLDRNMQACWLHELRRILRPGGWALVSVCGEFAARFTLPREGLARKMQRRGFASAPDPSLDGIAPPGYYRGAIQSKAHTYAEWSKEFEIVDYIEAGMGNFQDLVVLRRPRD